MDRNWLGHAIHGLGVVLPVLGALYWYMDHESERYADQARAIGVLQTQQTEIVTRLDRDEASRGKFEEQVLRHGRDEAVQLGQVVTDLALLRKDLHR